MIASERVRSLLKKKKITQEKFCVETSFSIDRLKQMFRNQSDPKLELIQRILIYFPDINPYWLILGDGEMIKEEEKVVEEKSGTEHLEEDIAFLKAEMIRIQKMIMDGK